MKKLHYCIFIIINLFLTSCAGSKYNDDIAILAFPSNDFLWQEPGKNSEIKMFCSSNYGVTFDLFEKKVLEILNMNKEDYFKKLGDKKNFIMETSKNTADVVRKKLKDYLI